MLIYYTLGVMIAKNVNTNQGRIFQSRDIFRDTGVEKIKFLN
jgi:hypothetical protein